MAAASGPSLIADHELESQIAGSEAAETRGQSAVSALIPSGRVPLHRG